MHGVELATWTTNMEKGEMHNIVSLSEYIEAVVYDVFVEANTAVSYHPCTKQGNM